MRPPTHVKDLLRALLGRYATVTPKGLVLATGSPPIPELVAKIVRVGPARTLYQQGRPACRSLDGVRSLKGKECATCSDRPECTPQLLLDLDVDGSPYRLLLAFTSAKNFLVLTDQLRRGGRPLESAPVRVRVLDRGRWGEVRFEACEE